MESVQTPTLRISAKYYALILPAGSIPSTVTSLNGEHSEQHSMQVIRETMPALKALGACQGSCWLWPSITQVSKHHT